MAGRTMRAAVRREYGPPEVLAVEEVRVPTPADDELLIRVHAASVNLGDWELLTGKPLYIAVIAALLAPKPRHEVVPSGDTGAPPSGGGGLLAPRLRILGCDVAGRVESVGRDVTSFRPGDEVFGDCAVAGFGAFAEYVCVPEEAALVAKPAGMSFEQAAAIPQASFIALQSLRDQANVQPGQEVLINGAGGGAGTFSVQVARARGARVTGVDGPDKLEMIRSIGADHVIDYTEEEYTRNGKRYDVILDLAAHRSVFESRRSLTPDGLYLMAGGSWTAFWQTLLLGPLLSRSGNGRVEMVTATARREDLLRMTELFQAGSVRPVIDRCYPLRETGEAIRRLGEKRSRGKVLVTP